MIAFIRVNSIHRKADFTRVILCTDEGKQSYPLAWINTDDTNTCADKHTDPNTGTETHTTHGQHTPTQILTHTHHTHTHTHTTHTHTHTPHTHTDTRRHSHTHTQGLGAPLNTKK